MRYLIPIILLAGLATFSFAGDVYVDDANGDDASGGTSWLDAKKTIGAAWGDASDGDTIHIAEGTYDMGEESNDYLRLWADKGATFQGEKVSGGASDRTATIIRGSHKAAECVYLGDSDVSVYEFVDLTIDSNDVNNVYTIYMRAGADYAPSLTLDNVVVNGGAVNNTVIRATVQAFGRANRSVIIKNNTSITTTGSINALNLPDMLRLVIVDSSINHVNGYGVLMDGVIADTNIVNCTFTGTGTGLAVSGSGLDAQCDTFKFTGNTITTTGSGLDIREYIYFLLIESNTFTNTNNAAGQGMILVGTNDQTDTNPIGSTYILRNNITYLGTDVGHCIAIGGGCDYAEVAYNTINAEGDASETGMGIVVKGDGCNIHHNFIRCQRGIWIKGGQNTKVQYNTVYLAGTGSSAIGLEAEGGETAQYSVITNNIFDATNGTYAFKIQGGGWDGGATDPHSQIKMDWNCYVAGSSGLAYDDAAPLADLAALKTKWATWSGLEFINNDANSIEADPQFMDASNVDFRLKPSSPCLNAGDSTLGLGNTSIGAWQGVSRSVLLPDNCTDWLEMDFNNDCKVDFEDYATFAQTWAECNLDPPEACWE